MCCFDRLPTSLRDIFGDRMNHTSDAFERCSRRIPANKRQEMLLTVTEAVGIHHRAILTSSGVEDLRKLRFSPTCAGVCALRVMHLIDKDHGICVVVQDPQAVFMGRVWIDIAHTALDHVSQSFALALVHARGTIDWV